ncbi:MAG: NAD(P)H-hydrate dehydratase [Betaproteobacteria bacterium]
MPKTRALTLAALRRWPLPKPSARGDKEARGHVWVIGGSPETPGAVILAAEAAMRAGAGKLTIATVRSVALAVAIAVPESRVIALAEDARGAVRAGAAAGLDLDRADAVLIGPGMADVPATARFVRTLLRRIGADLDATVVLDAAALSVARPTPSRHRVRFTLPTVLTPHAGEMAKLMRTTREAIESDPLSAATGCAAACDAVVALKGSLTYIAAPPARPWMHDGEDAGLAMSGSGDVLAGIIAGLAARGGAADQAVAWGVLTHARSGALLRRRRGPIGYLARELCDVVPEILADAVHA